MQTTNTKCLILGAVCAIAAVLAGEGLAHADCDNDDQAAYRVAFDATAECPVDGGVTLVDDQWVAYCSTVEQMQACEDVSSLVDCMAYPDADSCDVAMGKVYEACLVIADRN